MKNENGLEYGCNRLEAQTPKEGIQMNDNTTVPQTTDIHETLRHLFGTPGEGDFHIRAADVIPAPLPEGDPLWIDQDDMVLQAEDKYDNATLMRIVDLKSGASIHQEHTEPHQWMSDNHPEFNYLPYARKLPNTYVVTDEHLIVFGGLWQVRGEVTEDGYADWYSCPAENAKVAHLEAEWLAAHADAIAAAQPHWADSNFTEVDFTDEYEPEAMMFSRRFGDVAIEQAYYVDGDNITPADVAQILIDNGIGRDGISVDDASQVGVDLIRAAQAVYGPGEVSAGMFEIVANALVLEPVDLYALAKFDKDDPENDITLGDLNRVARYLRISPSELYAMGMKAASE